MSGQGSKKQKTDSFSRIPVPPFFGLGIVATRKIFYLDVENISYKELLKDQVKNKSYSIPIAFAYIQNAILRL